MDTSTDKEKEQAWVEFQKRQNIRIRIGKTIVIIIAAVNFIWSIINAFTGQNPLLAIFTVVVQLILSIALIMGVGWIRYLFAIVAGLSVISGLASFINPNSALMLSDPTALAIVFVLLSIAFNIASCILLFFNKCVSEFLYAQKTSR